jgi:hypothetical protein
LGAGHPPNARPDASYEKETNQDSIH